MFSGAIIAVQSARHFPRRSSLRNLSHFLHSCILACIHSNTNFQSQNEYYCRSRVRGRSPGRGLSGARGRNRRRVRSRCSGRIVEEIEVEEDPPRALLLHTIDLEDVSFERRDVIFPQKRNFISFPVRSGSLKRIKYSKLYSLAHALLLNVFSALKGTHFYILTIILNNSYCK